MTEKILLPSMPLQRFPVTAYQQISGLYLCEKTRAQSWQEEATVALLLE